MARYTSGISKRKPADGKPSRARARSRQCNSHLRTASWRPPGATAPCACGMSKRDMSFRALTRARPPRLFASVRGAIVFTLSTAGDGCIAGWDRTPRHASQKKFVSGSELSARFAGLGSHPGMNCFCFLAKDPAPLENPSLTLPRGQLVHAFGRMAPGKSRSTPVREKEVLLVLEVLRHRAISRRHP